MELQGHHTPVHEKPDHKPGGGGGHDKPDKPEHPGKKGGGHRPAAHKKPAKPAHHKPAKRPAHHKPAKRTAGRGDVDLIWFDDLDFRPLATGGHIH